MPPATDPFQAKATDGAQTRSAAAREAEPEEILQTFSEQVSDQLGGVRGMVESSVPVLVFVVVNVLWSLTPALVLAIATALVVAGYRLMRKESVRHALNGLFGIGIGALLAWRTGSPKDFYLPGILYTLGYGIAMVGSVVARRPLVGWIWSLVADKGAIRWRLDDGLRRIFAWLTLVWATIFFAKAMVNLWVYFADSLTEDQKASILGIMRIALGFPPYALLLALTVWAVRRYQRRSVPAPAL